MECMTTTERSPVAGSSKKLTFSGGVALDAIVTAVELSQFSMEGMISTARGIFSSIPLRK